MTDDELREECEHYRVNRPYAYALDQLMALAFLAALFLVPAGVSRFWLGFSILGSMLVGLGFAVPAFMLALWHANAVVADMDNPRRDRP